MRMLISLLSFSILSFTAHAAGRDSLLYYRAADSVKAVAFFTDLRLTGMSTRKSAAGIGSGDVRLLWQRHKKKRALVMTFPAGAEVVASGIGVSKRGKRQIAWPHDAEFSSTYSLMLVTASDSAGNFMLYSGYVFVPALQKWKLLGCVKMMGRNGYLDDAYSFHNDAAAAFSRCYFQRSNGSWKSAMQQAAPPPVINLLSHADSTAQLAREKAQIERALAKGITKASLQKEDVYYRILKEGNGKAVKVTDTVSVFYKGYLFEDGAVFDQTADKPARFPLNRLIRGWQVGVPLITAGGKIQLVIPSALAYSIRTRSPKIPPNSILVFEIEVLAVE